MMVHRGIRLVFWVILSFLLSSAVCITLYFVNNKYTDPAPQAENGYLDLTQETEETYPLRFLHDGTGIGTESVRAVVKRLDGQIRFQTLSDHFQVSVILPAEQKIL